MNCLTEKRLREYLDNELRGRELSRADNHLDACESCRERLAEMRGQAERVRCFMTRLDPYALPLLDYNRLRPGRRHPVRRLLHARVGLPVPLLAGLVVLILVMAGVVLFQQRAITRLSSRSDAPPRRLEIMIGSGTSIQNLTLDLDMSGYTPVKNPTIRIVKEKKS